MKNHDRLVIAQLAALIQYVRVMLKMKLAFVSVITEGIHMLDVALVAHSARIAQEQWLVLISNVLILVITHVVHALVVEWSITIQFAFVLMA